MYQTREYIAMLNLRGLVVMLVAAASLKAPESATTGNVIYYVSPVAAPPKGPSACPSGQVCRTWDEYAENISKYFEDKSNVSMIFLSGTHIARQCLNINSYCPVNDHCRNLTMSSADSVTDSVIIQLQCGINLGGIIVLSMSDLTIWGMQKFGVELSEAPEQALILNWVTLVGGAFWLGGHTAPVIAIIDSNFEASFLDVSFEFSGIINVTIVRSTFTSSYSQNNVICMAFIRSQASILFYSVYTSSSNRSDIVFNSAHINNCYDTKSRDVAIHTSGGVLNSVILNSTFAHSFGTALYYHLDLVTYTSELNNNIQITSCQFKYYNEGAVILKFSSIVSFNMTFANCTFAENTYIGRDGGASGVQVIFPLSVFPSSFSSNVMCIVSFRNCQFIHNKEQVVLLYKNKNVTFTDCTFAENTGTALVAFHTGRVVFSGEMNFLKNSAYRGSGLVLIESVLYLDFMTSITFYGNHAFSKGGAIIVEGSLSTTEDDPDTTDHCFYRIWWRDGSQKINFTDNHAMSGGHNIYGAPLASHCLVYDEPDHKSRSIDELQRYMFNFQPETLSSVSSDPKRVCLCSSSGVPLCDDINSIFLVGDSFYPGEVFYLSLVVIGVEFGTATGVVQANLTESDGMVTPGYSTVTEISKCTDLNFSIHHSSPGQVQMYITVEEYYAPYYSKEVINEAIDTFQKSNVVPTELLSVPIFIDILLLPCPPGFILVGDPPVCTCYPQIAGYVTCLIVNGTGFISRSDEVWIGIDNENNTIFSSVCPFEHCNFSLTQFNIMDADSQCAFHHSGRLCGGCDSNSDYSLAIGSTHCVHCYDDRFFSLMLFFVAAGLVLVILIHLLNLTVTEGTIHGVILYANIVWTHQQVLFPQQSVMVYPLRVFLAWLNLDFGIESCFAKGLTAFWKTWLQFFFPLYVWSIAGLIIIACRHSVKLTNVFGDKAVPTLATLLLLSYLKLLRIIVDICVYTTVTVFPSQSTLTIWSLDGDLIYAGYPHIFLLVVAIAVTIFVYLPYTVVIFLIQWLRKISHLKPFKWVIKLNPFFDAHLAPLKDKHHYWLGTVLILRGVLLIVFTLIGSKYPKINLFVLLISTSIVGFYMIFYQIFKSRVVLFLEGLSFINLILLTGGSIYVLADNRNNAALVNVSVSVTALQFCGIVVMHIVKVIKDRCTKKERRDGYTNIDPEPEHNECTQEPPKYRDSIFEDVQ